MRSKVDGSASEPKLSVVVVSYNMARELPRTLRSLSVQMQKGLDEDDYEIVVVDNGSSEPFDQDQCQSIAPNVSFLNEASLSPSPAAAVNRGLAYARGELIGVMIDGARMASPGLLRGAMDAAKLHPNTVVGTLAFHLGESVQMMSLKGGYDQAVEDELLEMVPWENDGYRLFDISVFAGSSARGWFCVPAETNAMFMRKPMWEELGGLDEQFRQPGGGLVNHDTWCRACNLASSRVVMLLGEATFHQFHGGIATNSATSKYRIFQEEYVAIRGHHFVAPKVEDVQFFGTLGRNQTKSVLDSAYRLAVARRPHEPEEIARVNPSRPFASHLPAGLLSGIQEGVMKTTYNGVPFLKSPFDIGIYLRLLSRQRPESVIEVGTRHGGSALWFADMLTAAGVEDPRVISIDIEQSSRIEDERIEFVQGDAANLGAVLDTSCLRQLPRPLLVIEDSSHYYQHSLACLEFFDPLLQNGDYIVIEDGIVSQFAESQYRRYQNGPNRAVADFLASHGTDYEIDTELCDLYGFNMTYNPNGYLKRL